MSKYSKQFSVSEGALSLHKTFEALSKYRLKLHYSSANILQKYMQVAGGVQMDGYLQYVDDHRSYMENHRKEGEGMDIFHVILNVQVDKHSDFVPFYEIYSTKADKGVFGSDERQEILGRGISQINYNFAQFTGGFFRRQINGGLDAPLCQFKVTYSETGLSITDIRYLSKVTKETLWFKCFRTSLDDESKRVALRDDLLKGTVLDPDTKKSKVKKSFVEVLSQYYAEKGIKELWYTFFNLDSDYDSGVCLTRVMILSSHRDEVDFFMEKQLDKIREIVSFIRSRYVSDLLMKNRYEAIKSAMAAIMSRNMSHNLGSHYLFYTKDKLEKIADESMDIGPDVRGAAKVLSYIQGRMDYLAMIVANDKYPYGSVNFKSQIWDELTIDDFSKRHYGNSLDDDFIESIDERQFAFDYFAGRVDILRDMLEKCHDKQASEVKEIRKSIELMTADLSLQLNAIGKRNTYSRTTNYLLTNLIRSENYSRPSVIPGPDGKNSEMEFHPLYLYASLWNDETSHYDKFTGSNDSELMVREDLLKKALSTIYLAFPGGTMSCHAFYNILENFIRNSAKYSWMGIPPQSLTFTVALKVDKKKKEVIFTIFDDKHDALKVPKDRKITLLQDLNTRLRRYTKVLGEYSTIDKSNKGLKEMLFSAIWLKSNESDDTMADIIAEIEDAKPKRRLALIRRYAFEFLSVDDNGVETSDSEVANLALRFSLPLFTQVEFLDSTKIHGLNELARLHTDVVAVNKEVIHPLPRPCESLFTRVFYVDSNPLLFEKTVRPLSQVGKSAHDSEDFLRPVVYLYSAIQRNLDGFDNYMLQMGSSYERGFSGRIPNDRIILFSDHLSTKTPWSELKKFVSGQYAYVDTISGGNFTKSLASMFRAGLARGNYYRSFADLYLALKIKESALSRITIIDERLFNSVKWNLIIPEDKPENDGKVIDIRLSEMELSMKNVRVLNFYDHSNPRGGKRGVRIKGFSYLSGNVFNDVGPYAGSPNATTFLSIHLGIIEKMLKSSRMEKPTMLGPIGQNPFAQGRVDKLMSLFQRTFGFGPSKKVHICIHSGRGNFSQELEGPLKEYPFIGLASLESAFNNSKYLLSQLFYNTVYIGKGEVNN